MDENIEAMLDWMKKNETVIEKAKIGLDPNSILFKDAHGATLEFHVANENGKPQVSRKVFGVVPNPQAFQVAVDEAQARYACNLDYDEFKVSSTQFNLKIQHPKSILIVRYIFESMEEVRAAIKGDELPGIIDHVREFSTILEAVTAPKEAVKSANQGIEVA